MSMLSDTMTESFSQEVEINGVTFNTVKLFHPRAGKNTFVFES
jgi:hypothetical protein